MVPYILFLAGFLRLVFRNIAPVLYDLLLLCSRRILGTLYSDKSVVNDIKSASNDAEFAVNAVKFVVNVLSLM